MLQGGEQHSSQDRKIKPLPPTSEDSPHKEVSSAPRGKKKASSEFQVHRVLMISASEASLGSLHGHSWLSFIFRQFEIAESVRNQSSVFWGSLGVTQSEAGTDTFRQNFSPSS